MCLSDLPWNLHWLLSHSCGQLVLSVPISAWKAVERYQCVHQELGSKCHRPPGRRLCGLLYRICIGVATLSHTLLPDATDSVLGGNRSDATALAVISPSAGIIS